MNCVIYVHIGSSDGPLLVDYVPCSYRQSESRLNMEAVQSIAEGLVKIAQITRLRENQPILLSDFQVQISQNVEASPLLMLGLQHGFLVEPPALYCSKVTSVFGRS